MLAVLGLAVVALAVVGGVGWLYLLRDARALAAGPTIDGALPLQQLAGNSSQPLLRLAAAWIPAGLGAGLGLRLVRTAPVVRLLALAVVAAGLLLAAGAESDAIALTEPFAKHVVQQPARTATWVAVALLVLGALPVTWRGPRRRPDARAAASVR